MKIAVFTKSDNTVVRAELYNDKQYPLFADRHGNTVHVVDANTIVDKSDKQVDIQKFLANPGKFKHESDKVKEQAGDGDDKLLIKTLKMTAPFAFRRAAVVQDQGVL